MGGLLLNGEGGGGKYHPGDQKSAPQAEVYMGGGGSWLEPSCREPGCQLCPLRPAPRVQQIVKNVGLSPQRPGWTFLHCRHLLAGICMCGWGEGWYLLDPKGQGAIPHMATEPGSAQLVECPWKSSSFPLFSVCIKGHL